MAHWAKIDENNLVTEVIVTSNEQPDEGYQWILDNIGGNWIKTSYNTFAGIHSENGTPLRKNYASIGYTYDEQRDAFIPPKPTDKETLTGKPIVWEIDEETCQWIRIVVE